MGYYTEHELEILESELTVQDLYEKWENGEIKFEGFDYALESDGSTYTEVKWYNHEKDMIELSKEFPTYLFKLKGEGEEAGDLWVKYYKNGKSQTCGAIITFEDYDESKLA